MANQPTAEARAEGILAMRCPRCASMLFHNYGVIECYACGWELSIGTRFVILGDPTGRTYVCADRGLGGEACGCLWVDVFWRDEAAGIAWLADVGDRAEIEVQALWR